MFIVHSWFWCVKWNFLIVIPRCFDTTAIFFWWNFNFEEVLFYRPNLSWVYINGEEECYNTIDYNILDYDTFCNYFEKQTKVNLRNFILFIFLLSNLYCKIL